MFKIITFLLLACFYTAYFVKQIMLKKRGINTNRLAKGEKPKRTLLIETFLLVITYITAVVQFLSVILSDWMGYFYLPTIVRIIGMIIILGGSVFFVLAIMVMKNNWRAGIDKTQKTQIVSNGIYRLSRNPAFLGFDLLYLGTFLAFPNIIMMIFAVIGIVLLHLQILEEEKHLGSVFGEEYLTYKGRVGRYFLII